MQRNYQPFNHQKPDGANEQAGERRRRMTREERLSEIERCKLTVSRNDSAVTADVSLAWGSIIKLVIRGEPCQICQSRGHTLFKCPSYAAIKSIKNGMPIIRPYYNCLVAKEMIRIHEEALEKGEYEEIPANEVEMEDNDH